MKARRESSRWSWRRPFLGAVVRTCCVVTIGLCLPGRLSAQRPLEPTRAPTPLVTAAFDDGPALAARIEALAEGIDLPFRARFGLGLARAALVGATGGLDLEQLGGVIAPGRGFVGVFVDGERPVGFARFEVPVDHPGLAEFLEQLGDRVATRRDGGWLTVAADAAGAEAARAIPPPLADDAAPAVGRIAFDVDVAALRRLRTGPPLGTGVDPLGRLFTTAWLSVAERATRAQGTLTFGADRIGLRATLDAVAAADPRATATLPEDPAALPPAPEGAFATLRLDRSLGRFLRERDALLSPGEAAQLGGGLAIADALCGGSFVDDVLGALREPLTLFVVARAERDEGDADLAPPLDLPSFVVVAPLRDPSAAEDVERRFAHTLGLFVAAASVERARNREHPFRMRRRSEDGVHYHVLEPHEYFGPLPPPVDVTLSPTLAIAAGHAILATTLDGATRAVAALRGGGSTPVSGDRMVVEGAGLAAYLGRNQDLLEIDEILKKGVPPREAERSIDDLRGIVAAFDRLEAQVRPVEGATEVEVVLVARPRQEKGR